MAERKVYDGPNPPLTAREAAEAAKAGGFSSDALIDAIRISYRESGLDPDKHGTDRDPSMLSGDLGIMQINSINDTETARRVVGYTSRREWFDPVTNYRMAYYLYHDRQGDKFAPAWSAGPGGWSASGDPFYGTPSREEVVKRIAGGVADSGGGIPVIGDIASAAGGAITTIFGGVFAWQEALGKLLSALVSGDFWRRVGIAALGALLLVAAIATAI